MKEVFKVGVAKNYTPEQLKKVNVLPFQRDVQHKKVIEESVRKFGVISAITLIHSTAITGRRELYVLDGNHRLRIFNYLETGCPTVVLDDVNNLKDLVELMGVINNTQDSWTLQNYVDIYCYLNYSDYKVLNQISHEFNVSISCASGLLSGNHHVGSAPGIKSGEFKISALIETKKTLEMKKELPSSFTGRMIISLHAVRLTNDRFSFTIFKRKLKENMVYLKSEKYDRFDHIFNSWF